MARITPKKPRVKPAIKPGSRARVKVSKSKKNPKKKSDPYRIRYHDNRNILGRFAKANKKPPVRYRRPVPKDMSKVIVHLAIKKLKAGCVLEFKYGKKQNPGQVGGWKNDPRPVLLVFHDDRAKYIEGINTNYLSEWYLKKLRSIMTRFPGVDGEALYNIFKRTAKRAIKLGYRKYIRSSFKDTYRYVYKDELARELDDMAKAEISDLPTADSANNAEI